MARECPMNKKGTIRTNTANDSTSTDTTNTTPPPATPVTVSSSSTPTTKLTCAQQICALEELMDDKEHSQYLDARDMGEDFWSAGT